MTKLKRLTIEQTKQLTKYQQTIELELAAFDSEGNYTRNAPPSIYNNLYPLATLSAKFESLLELEEEKND